MRKKTLFGMLIALTFLASCSLSPETELTSRTLELADLTLTNAQYVLKDKGQTPLSIQANEIAIYEKSNKAVMKMASFIRRDETGTITLTASADTVEANTESWDATLSGNIIVHDIANSLVIRSNIMTWLYDEQMLYSPSDELVSIEYEEDKRVEGYGLAALLDEAVFDFDRIVNGMIGK